MDLHTFSLLCELRGGGGGMVMRNIELCDYNKVFLNSAAEQEWQNIEYLYRWKFKKYSVGICSTTCYQSETEWSLNLLGFVYA